ncbi:MAG: flagellar M-ring protein FliF [Myxococcaceae bacterium]|nr:flagellar M-ring protein FliF [Myxococcaceae bacterium]
MFRTLPLLCIVVLSAGCRNQVHHALDERDANEVVAALTSRGFEASKVPDRTKKNSWAVEVADGQSDAALRLLIELKLPRPPRSTTREVMAPSGFVDTPTAEKLRQHEALEGDIEQTLETIDGVASAGVELVIPEAPRPNQPVAPSKASVLLRVQAERTEALRKERDELRALIAASVEGLRADDVTLIIDTVAVQISVATLAKPAERRTTWALVVSGVLLMLVACVAYLAVRLRRRTTARTRTGQPRRATPYATEQQAA